METIEIKSPKTSACQAEVEEERPSSPNDCAICLEQLTDKSFTNSCLHMFCFHCLVAWSKVKPECPLCKQDFCSIIHNIRSMDDYDEYRVPPAALRFPAPDSTSFLSSSLAHGNNNFLSHGHDFFSPNRRFFSYRTTLLSGGFSLPRERTSSLVIQPYVDNLQIQNDYPTVNSSSPSLIHFNRKDVYVKELEIRSNPVGRHRLSSPEFYRENEGQMHRLGRWLNRELTAISQLGIRFEPNIVLSAIMGMLPQYHIQSTIFHSTLYPYLGIHTRRFIREFYNFAISPYEMEEYDRSCVYVRQRTGSQLAFIVTVGGDDSEDVQVIPSQPVNHSVRPWIDFTEFHAPSYLGNRLRASNAPPSCQRLHPTNRSSATSSTAQVIDISDSENDDCVIIDEVKQTPETIILDDSDTDNIQPRVRPRSPSPIPSTSGYKPPRPPRPSSNNDDKSIIILPSPSNPEDSKPVFDIASSSSDIYGPLNNLFKMLSRKKSPSTSSVLSTDISVIESDAGSGSDFKKRKRKCKEKSVKKSSTRKKSINYVLSSSDSSTSHNDDSDWEESHKRKRKVKKQDKCDKKSRRRKKTPKSPKRKKPSAEDPDDHRESHKSKHVTKKRSKKSSKEPVENIASSSTNFKNPYPEYEDEPAPSNVNKPKLRSVVKKVEKPVEKHDSKISSVESDDDVVPGTSFGIRSCGDRKLNSFIIRRCTFSSDSD